MRTKSTFIAALAAITLALATGSAKAVTLASLIDDQGFIEFGDKIFSNFTYTGIGPGMPDAGSIEVDPEVDLAGNLGLHFSAPWNNIDPGTSQDSQIGFDVTVVDPAWWITDVHLRGNGDVTGANGLVSVVETVTDEDGNTYKLDIYDQHVNGVESTSLDAALILPKPVKKLRVVKDSQFVLGPDGQHATMSFLANYYSQTQDVPEPGTLAMLVGVAVGGSMFGFRRRRASRA